MIGSWLASDPETYDVGEYNAFYLTYRIAAEAMPGVQPPEWVPHLERYLAEVREHAGRFIADVARNEGCDSYVDSGPRNIQIADGLAAAYPDALFVLVLRHYTGVVQSLGRTGWPWVPPTIAGRARVWADAYAAATLLPADRTVAVSYDRLCADPEATLTEFSRDLLGHGIRADRLVPGMFGYSHAHVLGQPRRTLVDSEGRFQPMPSVDAAAWTPAVHAAADPEVRLVDERLRQSWAAYSEPAGWTEPPADSAPLVVAVDSGTPGRPSLMAAEYIVGDLDRAEELLVDLMGLEVIQRTRHPEFDADLVVLSSGPVAISLLHPTDIGDRPPFPMPEPKLGQLTFGIDDQEAFLKLRTRLVDGGAAVVHGGPRIFHLPEPFVAGVLGSSPALVVLDTSEVGGSE